MAGWKSWISIFDGTVIFLFFNALSEEERIGERDGDEKIELYEV